MIFFIFFSSLTKIKFEYVIINSYIHQIQENIFLKKTVFTNFLFDTPNFDQKVSNEIGGVKIEKLKHC